MKYLKLLGIISIAIVITACGSSGPEGIYTGSGGVLTFQSNGKVIVTTVKNEREYNYELEGNQIQVMMSQERIWELTLREDGSLITIDKIRYVKETGDNPTVIRYNVMAKTALKGLVMSMEAYKAESFDGKHTTDVSKLGYVPVEGVAVAITSLNNQGRTWIGTSRHAKGDKTYTWDSAKGGMQK